MEKLAFSWNEWTTMCVAVFLTWEFILYYQHICEERLGLPALPNTSSIQNLFIHLWSCFWDLQRDKVDPYSLNGWKLTLGSAQKFSKRTAFSGEFDIWDDHTEPQNVSGKASPSFSLTSMRFCCNEDHTLMQCPLNHRRCHFCSSSKFLKLFCPLNEVCRYQWVMNNEKE